MPLKDMMEEPPAIQQLQGGICSLMNAASRLTPEALGMSIEEFRLLVLDIGSLNGHIYATIRRMNARQQNAKTAPSEDSIDAPTGLYSLGKPITYRKLRDACAGLGLDWLTKSETP